MHGERPAFAVCLIVSRLRGCLRPESAQHDGGRSRSTDPVASLIAVARHRQLMAASRIGSLTTPKSVGDEELTSNVSKYGRLAPLYENASSCFLKAPVSFPKSSPMD